MRGRGQDVDIRESVKLVLKRDEYKRGGISELRIIAWIIDGKEGQPYLERREKWTTEDGHEKLGKSKGLSAGDFWILLERREEIGVHMKIPAKKIMELTSNPTPEFPDSSETNEKSSESNSQMTTDQDRPIMVGNKMVQEFDETPKFDESPNPTPLVGAEIGSTDRESDPWK